MKPEAQKVIDAIKAAGLKVWMRKPDDSWAVYGDDDNNIAYIQWDRWGYAKISTKHVPAQNVGSGFGLDDIPRLDLANLKKGFAFAPSWALSRDLPFIKKYDGIEHFKKSSPFNADYAEV